MKKMMFAVVLLIGSFAQASSVTCQISEKLAGVKMESEIAIDFGNTPKGVVNFNSSFGPGKLTLENQELTLAITDPQLNKPVTTKFGALDGAFSRMQIMPNQHNDDYLVMDCQMGGVTDVKTVKSATCVLNETAGSQQYNSQFEVPVAQNGHDFMTIPEVKIAPLTGWVMLYNGLLITFLQNKDTSTGLTGMGSWGQGTTVAWYPSAQNIKTTMTCTPNF